MSATLSLAELAPDAIEPYVGYKYLQVINAGSIERLQSGTDEMIWHPSKRATASCRRNFYKWESLRRPPQDRDFFLQGQLHFHPPPTSFQYATYATITSFPQKLPKPPPIELPDNYDWYYVRQVHESPHDDCSCGIYAVDSPSACEQYRREDNLLIEVALWGRVVIASKGARGQYAYPKSIWAEAKNLKLAQRMAGLYGVPVVSLERAPLLKPATTFRQDLRTMFGRKK